MQSFIFLAHYSRKQIEDQQADPMKLYIHFVQQILSAFAFLK